MLGHRNSETSSCTHSCRAWRAKSCLSLVTYRETSDGMENKSRMKCVYKIYEVHAPQIKSKCSSLTTFHYQIYVKTLTDKTFILDVEPSDTIAKSGAYPPINSVLFLRGRSYGMTHLERLQHPEGVDSSLGGPSSSWRYANLRQDFEW